jgi:RimJ/RimL family protein N-acetyltransferase
VITGGNLLAVPYVWNRCGGTESDITRNALLINHLVAHPMWSAASLSPEEIRMNAIWMATDPSHFKYEVWNGGRLGGMLILSRVVAPVDALFHFTLFGAKESGVTLFGAHKLLQTFLGSAFREFNLRRISMEISEHYPKLIRFVRQRLGFRYEGELSLERYERLRPHLKDQDESMRTAIALYGSRREAAHWNKSTNSWADVVLLRLTREEFEARASLGLTPQATRDNANTELSNESRAEASNLLPSTSTPGLTGHTG